MKLYILVSVIGTIILSGIFFDYFGFAIDLVRNHHEAVSSAVEESFVTSIVIFTAIYFVSTAFSLPLGTALTLIGGYLFNIFYGFFAVVIGATLGALALFMIVRSRSMKNSHSAYSESEILSKIKTGVEKDLWGYLFFIRFFPIFPFWFVNIAPALLGLRFIPYLVTTFFGIMPATFFIIILGAGIDDILNDNVRNSYGIFEHEGFLLGLCALSFLSIFPIIYKRTKSKK